MQPRGCWFRFAHRTHEQVARGSTLACSWQRPAPHQPRGRTWSRRT